MKQHSLWKTLHILILFTQCQAGKMKLSFGKMVLRHVRESTSWPRFSKKPTELPVSDKVKFCKFCDLRPKNVLLLKSILDQCKSITIENFINKLEALSILYDSSSFWDTVLYNNTTNCQCWQGNCEDCADGKKVTILTSSYR